MESGIQRLAFFSSFTSQFSDLKHWYGGRRRPQATVVVRLAWHWALAGDRSAAQPWATAAGDHALEHLAPSEAATWYADRARSRDRSRQRPAPERADLMVRPESPQQRAGDPGARDTPARGGRHGPAFRCTTTCSSAPRSPPTAGSGGSAPSTPSSWPRSKRPSRSPTPPSPTTYARLLALYARELIHTPRHELRRDVAQQRGGARRSERRPAAAPADDVGADIRSRDRARCRCGASSPRAAVDAAGAAPRIRSCRSGPPEPRTSSPSSRPTRSWPRVSLGRITTIASDLGEPRCGGSPRRCTRRSRR